ncbi:DUF5668 domain-containing protein [soil metagenome]
METQNTPIYKDDGSKRNRRDRSPLGGVILVLIGVGLLARQLDLGIPHWLVSAPMIPIAIGLFIGARQSFRFGGWIIPIVIGAAFLLDHELDFDLRHFIWPAVIITIGLVMIIRPRKRNWEKDFMGGSVDNTAGDYIDSSVAFGGIKKNIISKNFLGGRIENMFGGTDLNMMQADFKGTVTIDFNVAFGGVKLLVPPQWNVRNEITAILGGVDDKRPLVPDTDQTRVLVLKGTVMFGGVDIKSY